MMRIFLSLPILFGSGDSSFNTLNLSVDPMYRMQIYLVYEKYMSSHVYNGGVSLPSANIHKMISNEK